MVLPRFGCTSLIVGFTKPFAAFGADRSEHCIMNDVRSANQERRIYQNFEERFYPHVALLSLCTCRNKCTRTAIQPICSQITECVNMKGPLNSFVSNAQDFQQEPWFHHNGTGNFLDSTEQTGRHGNTPICSQNQVNKHQTTDNQNSEQTCEMIHISKD